MKNQNFLTLIFVIAALFLNGALSGQRIYKVTNPQDAHVKVYVTTDINQADIKVKIVDKAADANKDGMWFQTATQAEAMLRVYETTNATEADVKVYYVTEEQQAGWVNASKRQFFKGDK
ncbi:MAG: hypothetical protein A2275_06040 [Bacteroidetes bacterium RIFOXYA12_FULL_35_11]|nr:MAG: hypothetical protein A2275_06040 [Bacteroidetes bacterium RIFOXYA12_FULL_35_11]